MRRRAVIFALASTAVSPFLAHAQQPEQKGKIAVLTMYPESDPQGPLRAQVFRRELEKLGWTIGGNLQIDFHWGTGDVDWVRSAIAQILAERPEVMLANGDSAVRMAQQSTQSVPVIFIASGDPVGDGLVKSLAHPGGNITGFAVMEPSLGEKLLGMLKQVAPRVRRVAVFVNPDNATHRRISSLLVEAGPRSAVEVMVTPVRERG